GWTVDEEGFERALEEQRARAHRAERFGRPDEALADAYSRLRGHGELFVGYDDLTAETHITGLIHNSQLVERVEEGQEAGVVLAQSPFYPEGGGQMGDSGTIEADAGRLEVLDTQRVESGVIVHRARVVAGSLAVNDQVHARVDPTHRADSARNHTGTHLLHAALRLVLGEHVRQMGSLVAPDRLRFDFSHTQALNPDELAQVREMVNEHVRRDIAVQTQEASYDEAIAAGAIAFFGDKYGDRVRVVSIPDDRDGRPFSTELCGGTHVHETGEVGFFMLLPASSIGAGVRRVEAFTGHGAEHWIAEQIAALDGASRLLNTTPAELEAKILGLQADLDAERKGRAAEERRRGQAAAGDLAGHAEDVEGVKILISRVDATNPGAMLQMGDTLKQRLGSSVIMLGMVANGKSNLLAMVTPDLTGRVKAGDLIKQMTGGKGGGRPDTAQGGGIDASELDAALDLGRRVVKEALADRG
ncbi:MAG: alanine--tRNA ligase-related protein, partial [Dehalococcoidia bacterium]